MCLEIAQKIEIARVFASFQRYHGFFLDLV